jgi:hypothetical protein
MKVHRGRLISAMVLRLYRRNQLNLLTDASVGPDQPIPDAVKQNLNDIIDQAIAQSDVKKI